MRSLVPWLLILWIAVVLEHSRPELFASCSLVLPTCVACVLWHQNSVGMIAATAALLVRWLASGSNFPIEVVVLVVGASWLLTRRVSGRVQARIRSGVSRVDYWGAPVLLVAFSLLAHVVLIGHTNISAAIVSRAIIAGPLLAGLRVLMGTSEELGPRGRL